MTLTVGGLTRSFGGGGWGRMRNYRDQVARRRNDSDLTARTPSSTALYGGRRGDGKTRERGIFFLTSLTRSAGAAPAAGPSAAVDASGRTAAVGRPGSAPKLTAWRHLAQARDQVTAMEMVSIRMHIRGALLFRPESDSKSRSGLAGQLPFSAALSTFPELIGGQWSWKVTASQDDIKCHGKATLPSLLVTARTSLSPRRDSDAQRHRSTITPNR